MGLSFQYHSGERLSYILLSERRNLGAVVVERGGRWMVGGSIWYEMRYVAFRCILVCTKARVFSFASEAFADNF